MAKILTLDFIKNLSIDQTTRLYQLGYGLEDRTNILSDHNISTLQTPLLDPVINFGKVTVSTGYGSTDTSIVLNTGDGAKLPDPSISGAFNLVWWNATDYSDPSDDPNKEIVRCTARATNTLTATRGQEGTTASVKNLAGKTYKMVLSTTAKMITDISNAITARVSKSGDTMSGTLNLPSNGLVVGTNQLIVSGGNVGIGATPSFPLQMDKDLGVTSGENIISVIRRMTGSPGIAIGYKADGTSATRSILRGINTFPLDIGTGSTPQALTILDNGNVGIGISTISTKLDVRSDTIGSIGWGSTSTLKGELTWGTVPDRAIIRAKASHDLSLGANDQFDQLYIKSGGNVGIGTASPSKLLSIYGTSNPTAYIQAGDSTGCNMEFWAANRGYITTRIRGSEGGAVGRGVTFFYNRDDIGSLNANMTIDGQYGFVGIGTTSPGRKLDIRDSNNQILGVFNTTGATAEIAIQGLGAGGRDFRIRNDGKFNIVDGSASTTDFTIDQSGNVGIGTTAPTTLLDISGPATAGSIGFRSTTTGATGYGSFVTLNSVSISGHAYQITSTGGSDTEGLAKLSIRDNSVGGTPTRMVIDSSGNVGIGTTGPLGKLHVGNPSSTSNQYIIIDSGSSYQSAIDWMNAGITKWVLYRPGGSDDLALNDVVGERIRFQQGTGNVGIGTNSPASSLDIQRNTAGNVTDLRISGDNGASDGGSGISLMLNNVLKWSIFQRTQGTPSNSLSFSTSENDYNYAKMVITTAGNVGIGTTSPYYKLDISGTSPIFANIRVSDITGGQAGLVLQGDSSGPATRKVGIVAASVSSYFRNNLHFVVNTAANSNNFVVGTDTKIYVDGLTGAVGVSTTSPGYTLDVAGACHASSFPTSSDTRFKQNVMPLSDVLSRIRYINGVSFEWNSVYQSLGRATGGKREIGLIAQEVEQVFPELISTFMAEKDGFVIEDARSIDYGRMTAILVEGIKELANNIEILESRLAQIGI